MPLEIATTTLERASQVSGIASAFFALLSLISLGYVVKFTYIIKKNNTQNINNFTWHDPRNSDTIFHIKRLGINI